MTKRTGLYVGLGPVLTHYEVDVDGLALTRRDSTGLPGNVQYIARHVSLPLMYVATSDWVSAHDTGSNHHLQVFGINPDTGAVTSNGPPVRLAQHPVQLCTDQPSEHLLVASNIPAGLQVFRLEANGAIGDLVPQSSSLDWGCFPHQIRISADNQMAVLVTRGNPARGKDEHRARQVDPGALKVFEYNAGLLGEETTVAPGGGWHFGPRNIDFHPRAPWVFASLETQNKLCVFKREGNRISPEPLYQRDTLVTPDHVPMQQIASTLRLHPNGRFVYCVNRGHMPTEYQGQQVVVGADNTFAVFSIDEASGEPTLIQHIDSMGLFTRTFAIDPSGKMLIACNSQSRLVKQGDEVRWVPANLAVFEVRSDGTLKFARSYEMEKGWLTMGMASY